MRKIIVLLYLITTITSCRKNYSELLSSNLHQISKEITPPTFQTTNDSIITMVQFIEDNPIISEYDTLGNSNWDLSSPILVFWTKGNKKYVYRRSANGIENTYLADYTGKYNLIDTSQSVSILQNNWADWMRAYSVSKQVLDSPAFTLQVNKSTLNKMYITKDTKILAASLPASPMFIGQWINTILNRIKGKLYKLSTVEETNTINDAIIKSVDLYNDEHINKESDTIGNFIWQIKLHTESGKQYIYYGDNKLGRYTADYVGKFDFIDESRDTLNTWKDNQEDDTLTYATFPINKKLADTIGFIVQMYEGGVRKLYLTNNTTVSGEIQKMPIRFMSRWYNIALNRLRGRRFREAYFGN
jgi:hypothetical protein